MEAISLSLDSPRVPVEANFVYRCPPALPQATSFHPVSHFLYYQVEGTREMEDQEELFSMEPGDVILFYGGHTYPSHRLLTSYRAMNILFSPRSDDRCCQGTLPMESTEEEVWISSRLHTAAHPEIRQLFTEIVQLTHSRAPLRRAKASALLKQLLIELAIRSTPRHADQTGGAVEYAIDYLERNLDQRISIDDLAALVGMSRRHLTRSFRSATGRSIGRYHLETRMRLATSLLRTSPGITTREIADTLGFYDEFHFSRSFKQVVGVSPSQYRLAPGN